MSQLTQKWQAVLDMPGCPEIKDQHRREVTAILIENQIQAMKQEAAINGGKITNMLNEEVSVPLVESAPAGVHGLPVNNGGTGIAMGQAGTNAQMAGYDTVLINLVRRAMPQLIAFDVCGVQPMTMPTGLIFAMKSRYNTQDGAEALYNEANTGFSGIGTHEGSNWADGSAFGTGTGMPTSMAEGLGSEGNPWKEMGFSIERTSVIAKTRALKAQYSVELAQDLKAVHGLDAEAELSNILATEIITEINREIIRTIYMMAEVGCEVGTAQKGVFDLDLDSDGRWSAEKFKGLLYQIEKEANRIAQKTRRGRGNFIICSSNVASALQMAGMLDYAPQIQNNLNVNEAQTTFAGILNGKYKVFVDPYVANGAEDQFCVVGYKGASAYDAGLFYCPYVPLQLFRAVDPATLQPVFGFKTRYGLAANPMIQLDAGQGAMAGDADIAKVLSGKNYYYRKFTVRGL